MQTGFTYCTVAEIAKPNLEITYATSRVNLVVSANARFLVEQTRVEGITSSYARVTISRLRTIMVHSTDQCRVKVEEYRPRHNHVGRHACRPPSRQAEEATSRDGDYSGEK